VVSPSATATRESSSRAMHRDVALHGHASLPSGPRPFRSARPLDPARRTPRRNTRVDNIFRVYSRQFSRGGVALIAVVHRGFASVPPSSLTPVFTSASSLPPSLPLPLSLSLSLFFSTCLLSSVFSSLSRARAAILQRNPFVPRREKRAAVRAAALSALICAQQERRELMHVAHAGRESVGSLSSRTPALTRIHHRTPGLSDREREGGRERAGDCPSEREPPPRGRFCARSVATSTLQRLLANTDRNRPAKTGMMEVSMRRC